MNELTEITATDKTPIEVMLQVGEDGRVSSKSVYEFLGGLSNNYARWAKCNITENEFAEENEDYIVFIMNEENPLGGRPTTDYRLSVPFAKKLCMLSKSERGEQAREYFIKVEDTLKKVSQNLPALTTSLRPGISTARACAGARNAPIISRLLCGNTA